MKAEAREIPAVQTDIASTQLQGGGAGQDDFQVGNAPVTEQMLNGHWSLDDGKGTHCFSFSGDNMMTFIKINSAIE